MKEAGPPAIYKDRNEGEGGPAKATLVSNTQGGLLDSGWIPWGLVGFPLDWPTILGSPGSFGCSPVRSGKGLWRSPVVTASLWFYIWKHPILVCPALWAPHQEAGVRSRPASLLQHTHSHQHTHFGVSQALLPWTGPCHQMAAQTSAEFCRLAALTWNSWKRTLHSFLCINTGGSVHPPAAAWTKEFPHPKLQPTDLSPTPILTPYPQPRI